MNCIFASNARCEPSTGCGDCPNNKRPRPGYAYYGFDDINNTKPMTIKQTYKTRKKFEKLLHKMLDKGIIKSWYWNGSYHITFNN